MPILTASPANATATIAIFRLITQLAKERGLLLGHPVIQALIQQTAAWAEMLRTMPAVDTRITQADIDSVVGVATPEGALPAPSQITITNTDNHPTRIAALFQPTDDEIAKFPAMRLLQHVGAMRAEPDISDLRNVAALAQIMGMAWANTLVGWIKLILSSLGNTSGVAATDYTLARFMTAVEARRLIASGKGLCLIQNAHGWAGISADILTSNGAFQVSALGQRVVNSDGENLFYQNVYMNTDVMVTTGLPAAPAADVYGGCVYPGCLCLKAHANRAVEGSGRRVVLSTPLFEIYELGYVGGSVEGYEMVWYGGLTVLNANLGFRILHD